MPRPRTYLDEGHQSGLDIMAKLQPGARSAAAGGRAGARGRREPCRRMRSALEGLEQGGAGPRAAGSTLLQPAAGRLRIISAWLKPSRSDYWWNSVS